MRKSDRYLSQVVGRAAGQGREGEQGAASGEWADHGAFRARIGERRVHAAVVVAGERRHVFFEGRAYPFVRVDPSQGAGRGDDAGGRLTAPMPGKVIALLAEPGKRVERGAPLLVLEAMKMEHTIKAPRAGVVKAFRRRRSSTARPTTWRRTVPTATCGATAH